MLDYEGMPVPESRDLRPPEDDLAPRGGECVRCGYDLVGIEDDAPCPECGLLAERSRQGDGHLSDAPPGWLRGISVGVWLILAAHLLGGAWPFVLTTLEEMLWLRLGRPTNVLGLPLRLEYVAVAGFDVAAVCLLVGVWLLTRPQRRDADDVVLRWALRSCAALPAVTAAGAHWSLEYVGPTQTETWATVAFFTLTIGCAPIPALMFLLLRRLAFRVLHPSLAEHAAIVGVGLSATMLAIPAVAWVLNQDADWSRSKDALLLMLAISVASFLFAGWSALNCVRFALAFGRAHRGARRKWREADRSAGAF
jgi:hypothetical protein